MENNVRVSFMIAVASIIIVSTAYAEYKVTPKNIAKAEKMRSTSIKLGLDKIKPSQLVQMASNTSSKNREISAAEKQSLECVVKKAQDMQFKSPIEEYARYLADKDFAEKIDADANDLCGLNKLASKK